MREGGGGGGRGFVNKENMLTGRWVKALQFYCGSRQRGELGRFSRAGEET